MKDANMPITYTVIEDSNPRTGIIVQDYGWSKYLVREDNPTPGQPKTRFVWPTQVIRVG